VTFVLVGNVLIALVCLFVAWRLWQLKLKLVQVNETLLSVEQAVHNVLYGAPEAITKGQSGISQLRQQYQKLEVQLQRMQQAIALLGLGQTLWRQRDWRSQRSRSPRQAGVKREWSGKNKVN